MIAAEAKWSAAPMPAGDVDRLCAALAARPLPPHVEAPVAQVASAAPAAPSALSVSAAPTAPAVPVTARRVLFVPAFDVPRAWLPKGNAYPLRHGVTIVDAAAVLAALR